jgi:hypothetical protein
MYADVGHSVREAFEAAISASPYERSIARYPDDATRSAWPGNYRDIAVDLAWRMWQEAWRLSTVPAQKSLSEIEIRRNEDGSLDEIVGTGTFHLEQMDDNHWWMQFNDGVMVHLIARGAIKATTEGQE